MTNEITETGDCEFAHCDDANIPVDIWLDKDEDDGMWHLRAGNYMPRRGYISQEAYSAKCSERQPLADLVRDHVLPLYLGATDKLAKMIESDGDNLYYWQRRAQNGETK